MSRNANMYLGDFTYLSFTEAEAGCHLVPLRSGQIFALFKLFLKLQKLLRSEGCTGSTSLAEQRMRIAWRMRVSKLDVIAINIINLQNWESSGKTFRIWRAALEAQRPGPGCTGPEGWGPPAWLPGGTFPAWGAAPGDPGAPGGRGKGARPGAASTGRGRATAEGRARGLRSCEHKIMRISMSWPFM